MALAPLAAAVFITFFVIGMAMPVLPLHIEDRLGFGAFMVGLVAGGQFAASLVSRFWAGHFADSRGSKRAMLIGIAAAASAGVIYWASLMLAGSPAASATVLLVGRAVLGAAESFVITGALSWGLALGGPDNAGKVIAWLGMPMYTAFAIGAPFGSWLYALDGFAAIASATVVAPLVGLAMLLPFAALPATAAKPPSSKAIVRVIALPGLGLALASLGFGAITIFASLLFSVRGWPDAWAAFSAFGVAFILARVVLGHLPDRLGGGQVALFSVIAEAIGLLVMAEASDPAPAIVGAFVTGLGYSLVYPSLGVEAVRHAPKESRGLAMGAYTACLDLGLGTAGPSLGLIASAAGIGSVFVVSAVGVLAAGAVAIALSHDAAGRTARPTPARGAAR